MNKLVYRFFIGRDAEFDEVRYIIW